MIHSRILSGRFYDRELYISLNRNDKNVISSINCVPVGVEILSRKGLDYTSAVDGRFTLDTRGWSGIESLCWTRKGPVPRMRPRVLCVSVLEQLQSLNLYSLIKNENYTTFLLRWICELHELWEVKCSVWVFWWLLLFFLMLLTKQVITESIHFTLTSSQKWTAAIVPLLSDWNVSRNLQAWVVRSRLVEVPQLYTYLLFESNLTRDKCVISVID